MKILYTALFASALQKVQVNLAFRSIVRIFMINQEDTTARCKKKSSKLDIISLVYAYLCIG